jgi:hypothetical protein
MSEAKPQDGSTVKGYRTLSEQDIADMNSLKALSRQFISHLDRLKHDSDADPRWIAIAKTDMQTACMAACRAVAKPDSDS